MVKHIVMWNFLDFAEGKEKAENIRLIKERLENLKGKIPEIKFLEVGINFNPQGYDAALYSEFDTPEDLEHYQNHPLHKEISAFVSKVRSDRVVCDYTV